MSDFICLDVLERLIQLVDFKQATLLSLVCAEWSLDVVWSCIKSINIQINGNRGNVNAAQLASMARGAHLFKSVRSLSVSLFPNASAPHDLWVPNVDWHGSAGSCGDVVKLGRELAPKLKVLIVEHKLQGRESTKLPDLVRLVDPTQIQVLRVKGATVSDLPQTRDPKTGVDDSFFPVLRTLWIEEPFLAGRRGLTWIAERTGALESISIRVDKASTSLGFKCSKLRNLASYNPNLVLVDLQNCRQTSGRRDPFEHLIGRVAMDPSRWDQLEGICTVNTGLSLKQLRFSGRTVWDLCVRHASVERIFIHSDACARLLRACFSEEQKYMLSISLQGLESKAKWRWHAPAIVAWCQDELQKLEQEKK